MPAFRPYLFAAILLLPATALAQGTPPRICRVPFRLVDHDRNGKITFDEFQAFAMRALQHKGGQQAQMAQAHPQLAARRLRQQFNQIDTRRQGFITSDEWAACANAGR